MNIEKIKQLREHLTKVPDELFNMDFFLREYPCGTAGCLAGHTCLMEGLSGAMLWAENDCAEDRAVRVLELTYEEKEFMFYGDWMPRNRRDLEYITRQEAIQYLDKVIATNNVFQTIQE